jgi:hypothetical protein
MKSLYKEKHQTESALKNNEAGSIIRAETLKIEFRVVDLGMRVKIALLKAPFTVLRLKKIKLSS